MQRYMLDTNICIYVMKNRPRSLGERFSLQAEELCISSITLAELHYGVANSDRQAQNAEALAHFAARLEILPFAGKAAEHYGDLRAVLRRAGQPCGVHDMMIGAHARSEGLVLVTNNTREFDRMPGLQVENWV
ncbi:type II toxin-antitoxin system VapC family toxin [Ferrovibrio sp.]|uniref:type II toxin-antitoxin system tRNA(fMet)-specific endonuclease VapC n=1 Tax=Ferrovibrio sp. TaxID=1917215 RepID=UPI0035AEC892